MMNISPEGLFMLEARIVTFLPMSIVHQVVILQKDITRASPDIRSGSDGKLTVRVDDINIAATGDGAETAYCECIGRRSRRVGQSQSI
jgi:hypothetical protein